MRSFTINEKVLYIFLVLIVSGCEQKELKNNKIAKNSNIVTRNEDSAFFNCKYKSKAKYLHGGVKPVGVSPDGSYFIAFASRVKEPPPFNNFPTSVIFNIWNINNNDIHDVTLATLFDAQEKTHEVFTWDVFGNLLTYSARDKYVTLTPKTINGRKTFSTQQVVGRWHYYPFPAEGMIKDNAPIFGRYNTRSIVWRRNIYGEPVILKPPIKHLSGIGLSEDLFPWEFENYYKLMMKSQTGRKKGFISNKYAAFNYKLPRFREYEKYERENIHYTSSIVSVKKIIETSEYKKATLSPYDDINKQTKIIYKKTNYIQLSYPADFFTPKKISGRLSHQNRKRVNYFFALFSFPGESLKLVKYMDEIDGGNWLTVFDFGTDKKLLNVSTDRHGTEILWVAYEEQGKIKYKTFDKAGEDLLKLIDLKNNEIAEIESVDNKNEKFIVKITNPTQERFVLADISSKKLLLLGNCESNKGQSTL